MIHILTNTTSASITLPPHSGAAAAAVAIPAHASVLMVRAPSAAAEGLQARQVEGLPLIRLLAHLDNRIEPIT